MSQSREPTTTYGRPAVPVSTSYDNISFFQADQDTVVEEILNEYPSEPCVVSDDADGWVTVYHRQFKHKHRLLPKWARTIAKRIARPAVGVEIWYSSVFCYCIADVNGNIVDESYPEDPNSPTADEAMGRIGEPNRIPSGIFGNPSLASGIQDSIANGRNPEDLFYSFCNVLGINWYEYTFDDFFDLDIIDDDPQCFAHFKYLNCKRP